ncbi:MAG TPA: MFS transporter [Steroidobacteraceae bacterium]|nr:MFS transporter [Steroidobacteraceae bacterium]
MSTGSYGMSAARAQPVGLVAQYAWALFDGARSPYNVLVNIFVFSAYFSAVVVPDPVRGQVLWSYTSSVAALLVAFGAPVLGAIADAAGRRKPWLLGTVIVGVPSMCALWFATPAMSTGLYGIMAAVVGGTLFYEYSGIFCNAMLPNIASGKRIGFLSGLGYALGNGVGVLLFLFFLFSWSWNPQPLFGLDAHLHEPERAVGILAAVCLVVLGAPLFLLTPDSPPSANSIRDTVAHGLRALGQTVAKLGSYKNVAVFLVARMIFNEGFVVMMLFTGVFAATIMHWTPDMLITQGLINSVAAAVAGVAAGRIDQRIGSKRATMLFIAGAALANVVICSVTPDTVLFVRLPHPIARPSGMFATVPDQVFMVAEVAIAFFVTGGLATSRALMAKLTPPAMLNEFFGLYAMSGTATTFLGPAAIGALTSVFHDNRIGVAVGIVFLSSGFLLMFKVREES